MNSHSSQTVSFLKLSIHDHLVGYLAGYQNGKNVLHFAESFKNNLQRPTLSLITQQNFPSAAKVLTKPWLQYHQLPPTLSNLLPEGSLRELIAQQLKTHQQNEFQLLSYLGLDLPGALIATPIPLNEIPPHLLSQHDEYQIVEIVEPDQSNKFSLAGVQMKFSMKAIDRRFTIPTQNALGDWIIKTPSSKHKYVPNNEFSAMSLAKLAGINIPEIKLIGIGQLDLLPNIQLPDENHAYAIKRFDRHHDQRIHIEDFAQIFNVAPQQKYQAANYTNIAKVIYQYSEYGLEDVLEFMNRLLVNILLANGDAHLKNWSLMYQDQTIPRLAPAYDIVTTSLYFENETQFALNLAKQKSWYQTSLDHFQYLATKADIPWNHVQASLQKTLDKARTLWPNALQQLPIMDDHKAKLMDHWQHLHDDFKV